VAEGRRNDSKEGIGLRELLQGRVHVASRNVSLSEMGGRNCSSPNSLEESRDPLVRWAATPTLVEEYEVPRIRLFIRLAQL
jgi:hypothetical protein